MAKQTVGVQLIIFDKRVKEDLAGVLDEVAAAGYQAVETGFMGPQIPGRDFKKMLGARGLLHVGAHYGGDKADQVGPVIDWTCEAGGTEVIFSDLDTREMSLDLYKKKAAAYNRAGDQCRKMGLTLSYHNHNWEFAKIDNEPAIELLYRLTDPELVKACIDAYWVRDGGSDPAAFVKKHAKRLRILHAKDSFLQEVGKRSFAPVGVGVLDFPAIIKAMKSSAAPWIVTEEDMPRQGTTAAGEITLSRQYLRETIKI
jgi:sugar phosphate isomerase/epimerase